MDGVLFRGSAEALTWPARQCAPLAGGRRIALRAAWLGVPSLHHAHFHSRVLRKRLYTTQPVPHRVLQQFVATAVGIVLFFISLAVLIDIKFPDDACTMEHPPVLSPVCIHSYFFWNVVIVLYATVSCVLLILSAASAKRYLYDYRRNAWLEANPGRQLSDYEKREEIECEPLEKGLRTTTRSPVRRL